MKKFFKNNLHHLIVLLLIIILTICSSFYVFGFDLLKDEKKGEKEFYEACQIYNETGEFGDTIREGNEKEFFDTLCNGFKDYKEGQISGAGNVFVRFYENGLGEGFIFFISLYVVISVLVMIDLRNQKNKNTIKEDLKIALKSMWVGPVTLLLMFIASFFIRGLFSPVIGGFGLKLSYLISVLLFTLLYSFMIILSILFFRKKFKNKIVSSIAHFVFIPLLLAGMFMIWGYLGLAFGNDEMFLRFDLLCNLISLKDGELGILYIIVPIIYTAVLFAFAYLEYDEKLNNTLNKK